MEGVDLNETDDHKSSEASMPEVNLESQAVDADKSETKRVGCTHYKRRAKFVVSNSDPKAQAPRPEIGLFFSIWLHSLETSLIDFICGDFPESESQSGSVSIH
jgi:hypothetical protein